MLFQKDITLAFVAVCLTAAPSPSAALLKRQRVITDLTDSIIDERLFADWRRDKQKMNRSGIDPDAIERDMEERRWLKSGSYSYSEDSNPKRSAADSSNGSVIDFDTSYSEDSYPKLVADSGADSDSKNPETCKFKRKMYEPGQWIDLGTDKCKCDEGGSSKWVDCEQYKVGGGDEGALPSHNSDSNVVAYSGGVTVETGESKDTDEFEIKTDVVGCPFAGVATNNIVVNFDYMVKTNPEGTFNILATYTEIERIIFDSLASEIVDCSKESPQIIIAKSKGAERNLEVMLKDSYPDDQVVGTCDGIENCFIVRGAITVSYTENETEETATLYTMNKIKKKMESGEFNNQGDIISVEYLGKPGNFPDMKSLGASENDNNKSTKLPIILTCTFLFLALASFLAKAVYDGKRNSAKNSDEFMEENNDFFMEEPVDNKIPFVDDNAV